MSLVTARPLRTPVAKADAALKQRVHRRLVGEGAAVDDVAGLSRGALRVRLGDLLRDEEPLLATTRLERLVAELADEVAGLGPLEPLLADPGVTEVMVNGPGRAYVERHGELLPVALDLEAPAIVRLVERIVAPLGLRIDRASPMVDARLPDGSRLHAVIPPLAIDGPCVTIRRFGARAVPLDDFGVGAAVAAMLGWAVAAGWNLLVSGGTSAGKTTLLNALSRAIPPGERVVTIEETAELQLAQPHVVRLEARPANAEGAGGVTVRQLVRAALRMRPDRLVVGEVRGGEVPRAGVHRGSHLETGVPERPVMGASARLSVCLDQVFCSSVRARFAVIADRLGRGLDFVSSALRAAEHANELVPAVVRQIGSQSEPLAGTVQPARD